MDTDLILVSHKLCPYVQRVAIVLHEKGLAHERRNIDLARKPSWFLDVSPLGKTPVLIARGQPIFESAVICEYLEDAFEPRLHPQDMLERARHRSWMEFGSSVLANIAQLYSAGSASDLQHAADTLRHRFSQLENVLGEGPYFAGLRFSVVDAVFGPVFRYFDVIDPHTDLGTFTALDKVQAWRQALGKRPSVQQAVLPEYPALLETFLLEKRTELSRRMTG